MKSRVVVIAIALALVAGACGSRSDGDDGSSPLGTEQDDTGSQTASSASAAGMFGTLESPCGPGDASGSTDIGVTDDAINFSSVSDSGGQIGGLNKGIDDSQVAFVKWCNDQGGINGREIVLNMRNAALFDYGTQVSVACEESFALVGGLAVFDDVGAPSQVACGLPNVPAAAVSSVQSGADLTFQPLPNPPNQLMVGAATWVKEHYPDAITSTGIVHGDVASLDYITARLKEANESIGYEYVYDGTAAIGETNWQTFAVDMKNKDVKVLTFVSSWEEIIGLQLAMAQQDFDPEVTQLEANFYQEQYPTKADGTAEGSYVQITIWPFAEADQNPAMATYLEALEAAVPGAAPEMLGVQSFSASLLWATAVKSLGSNVTRAGLVDALANIHEWDGGGLHGTSDPGANKGSPCFILMQVEGDGFTRVFPTEADDAAAYEASNGFACDPKYVVDLTTNFNNGAKVPG